MDFFNNVIKQSNQLLKFNDKQGQGFNKDKDNQSLLTADNQANNAGSTPPQNQTPITSTTTSSTTSKQQQQATNNDNQNNENPSLIQADTTNENATDPANIAGEAGKKASQIAASIAADAEAVSQKAVESAKTFGNFLFSMANKAGHTVSQTAKQVKQAVESTSILADFTREQQEFVKEHGGSLYVGELPWAACDSPEAAASVKEQVLSLSQDTRNFVRNPPSGVDFQFDPDKCYPVALALLKEDPNLNAKRFEIVPKLVNEDTFWRNYFYRVSLIKQSVQTKSRDGMDKTSSWTSSRSSSGEGPDADGQIDGDGDGGNQVEDSTADTMQTSQLELQCHLSGLGDSRDQNTFESDSQKLVAEADDLKNKLKELNIGSLDDSSTKDDDKWEEELKKDLQEFEVVSGDVSALDEDSLEQDIQELSRKN